MSKLSSIKSVVLLTAMVHLILLPGCAQTTGPGVAKTRTVSVSWVAPTLTTNDQAIEPGDLGGFYFYCGDSSEDYTLCAHVMDGNATNHTFNIALTEQFIVMTAYNVWGSESEHSNPPLYFDPETGF